MSLQVEEARVRPRAKPCEICGRQVAMGQASTRVFLPFQFHSTSALHSSSFTCYSNQDKRAKPGNPKDLTTADTFRK